MRSNPRSPSSAAEPATVAPVLASWPAEWMSQQVAVAAESAAVLMRGMESMRGIQARAVQQASERHAAAAGSLRASGGRDAFALPSALLWQDLQDAARCWQDLAGAALETSAELWASAMHLVNTEDAFGTATRLFHA